MFVILKRKQKAVIEAACDAVKASLPRRMSEVCRNLSAHTAVTAVISTTTATGREIIKQKFSNSTCQQPMGNEGSGKTSELLHFIVSTGSKHEISSNAKIEQRKQISWGMKDGLLNLGNYLQKTFCQLEAISSELQR
ncbi:hypothetical protein T4E_4213 [Trichinella pseudospiralis]|uniref:Uncharacterized protein n=1 Tax=Trichinella pseudospiralis TaxID=6337 RepID=A0A0V0Y0D2_TRIPS|nr:hypothetical protein T4E_4213 [Trichinella pseudospiralis]